MPDSYTWSWGYSQSDFLATVDNSDTSDPFASFASNMPNSGVPLFLRINRVSFKPTDSYFSTSTTNEIEDVTMHDSKQPKQSLKIAKKRKLFSSEAYVTLSSDEEEEPPKKVVRKKIPRQITCPFYSVTSS